MWKARSQWPARRQVSNTLRPGLPEGVRDGPRSALDEVMAITGMGRSTTRRCRPGLPLPQGTGHLDVPFARFAGVDRHGRRWASVRRVRS